MLTLLSYVGCFNNIINNYIFSQELTRTLSHKTVNKASECLRQIVLGLVDNQFVSMESLLVFAYGTASESIPLLISGLKKERIKEHEKELASRERPDSFIIPAGMYQDKS